MQVYKAIKYIRLSYTDDKTVESDSVANQRRLIDDYIARHPEIEVVAEKIDDGYSGVLFDRPAFQEMMRMIEQGEANCVIVKDLSRLGREYIETGRYMRRVFPAYGVRFIAINDNVDTENDAADDLTVSVKNIMNEAYCRDISVKTRSALDVKRRSGDFVGAFTIYGYVKTGDKHKSLEVDEYAAGVVRDIFRKRLEGFSASHIADELNRMGILSPRRLPTYAPCQSLQCRSAWRNKWEDFIICYLLIFQCLIFIVENINLQTVVWNFDAGFSKSAKQIHHDVGLNACRAVHRIFNPEIDIEINP